MKADIHPTYNPVVFIDGEHEIITRSILTSKVTREIEGVSHYVIPIEISSYTHPFYSGKARLLDTEGRIERFNKRYNLAR
jgi:large subunit ribosomal protein L31